MIYDGDGMGDPSMKVYLDKTKTNRLKVLSYHGSAGVRDPGKPAKQVQRERQAFSRGDDAVIDGAVKTNADSYLNYRAQSSTWLKIRFANTFHAIERAKKGQIVPYTEDELVSISSDCEDLIQLKAELSRPKRIYTDNGKIRVESKKEMKARGVDSPNLYDAAVMAMSVSGPDLVALEEEKPPQYDEYTTVMDGVM